MIKARILLVRATSLVAMTAPAALAAAGYDVRVESDSLAGLLAVECWVPDLILFDAALPLITAEIFVATLRAGLASPPPVILLAQTTAATPVRVAGAEVVCAASATGDQFLAQVERALRHGAVVGRQETLQTIENQAGRATGLLQWTETATAVEVGPRTHHYPCSSV